MLVREFPRTRRIEEQMYRVLNELLRREVKDPRVAMVNVTGIEVSGDLSFATVYYSMLDPAADPGPAADGLAKASGFLRSHLGKALVIRQVPKLKFELDTSAEQGARMTVLIDEARARDRATQATDEDEASIDSNDD